MLPRAGDAPGSPEAAISQEPGASLARGESPLGAAKAGSFPCAGGVQADRLPLPPLVYLLTSYSWTRCCVIGNPRVLSCSEITSAIFVCVAAEFSGGVDAFFFLSAYNIF